MRIYPITTTNTIANTNPTIAFKFLFFILLFFVVRTGFEPVCVKGESLKFHQVFPLQELGLFPLVNYSLCFGIASTIPPPDYFY
jgi:hypothetical protein